MAQELYSVARKNKCYVIDGKSIREVGEQTLVRLKSPHIIGYRVDKKACIEDIGPDQVS